ncbi:hypothetical protein GCM10023213_48200 [Prosthecobacter algae]|uniref:TPR repeat protein n=1 Tax=Prosthecobacter algae TaxID=1144682 RepID=A0ABP9PP58_9BACT
MPTADASPFHLSQNGAMLELLEREVLLQRLIQGKLGRDVLGWQRGMAEWLPLGEIFQDELPPPLPAAAQAPAPVLATPPPLPARQLPPPGLGSLPPPLPLRTKVTASPSPSLPQRKRGRRRRVWQVLCAVFLTVIIAICLLGRRGINQPMAALYPSLQDAELSLQAPLLPPSESAAELAAEPAPAPTYTPVPLLAEAAHQSRPFPPLTFPPLPSTAASSAPAPAAGELAQALAARDAQGRFGSAGVRGLIVAAPAGNAEAQYYLSQCYYRGDGLRPDAEVSVFWLKKAAHADLPQAQYSLARFYQEGLSGLPQDDSLAFEWCSRAASLGWRDAMTLLSGYYRTGLGTSADETQARQWQDRAQQTLPNRE